MQSYTLDKTGFYPMESSKNQQKQKRNGSSSSPPSSLFVCTPPRVFDLSGDRFIPTRSNMNMELSSYLLTREDAIVSVSPMHNNGSRHATSCSSFVTEDRRLYNYKESILHTMFDTDIRYSQLQSTKNDSFEKDRPPRVLSFEVPKRERQTDFNSKLRVLYQQNQPDQPRILEDRQVNKQPFKILAAPDLVDNYYLNLLDWSSSNVLALGLENSMYLWNADTAEITELFVTRESQNVITSVSWANDTHLAVGLANGQIQIWDCQAIQQASILRCHADRVSTLNWKGTDGRVIASSGRDKFISINDLRFGGKRNEVASSSNLIGHTEEVCGLKWSPDETHLASGGNDNIINIWNLAYHGNKPVHTFTEHTASVKALAWCPWQADLLASGGGTNDKTIKFWNTRSGVCLDSIDTNSQICSIIWSKFSKELISSHGYSLGSRENRLCVWKYPSLKKLVDLTGHTARVLYTALSPDGTTVASAAGGDDETLRFWKVFEPQWPAAHDSPLSPSQKSRQRLVAELSQKIALVR